MEIRLKNNLYLRSDGRQYMLSEEVSKLDSGEPLFHNLRFNTSLQNILKRFEEDFNCKSSTLKTKQEERLDKKIIESFKNEYAGYIKNLTPLIEKINESLAEDILEVNAENRELKSEVSKLKTEIIELKKKLGV